ncbi:MAG TPA: TAXI family TRAP transporter solute-binding subunit [Stellaceae bacterium]|nr:TAXI family TRAP transporter solute-binding subunit [Stellaceae bacterium]
MKQSFLGAFILSSIVGLAAAPAPYRSSAWAQADPHRANPDAQASHRHDALAAARIRHALRDEVNSGLVGIVAGSTGDGDFDEATDLAASLDHLSGGGLRILPVIGRGAFQNAADVVFARGIDIGIIQSDVLAALKRRPPFPGIERFVRYIAKLSDAEVHILAGEDIRSVKDLASKKVNFGLHGSGTAFTAGAIFHALGVLVSATNFPQPVALEKLRTGEIAAMVYVAGKPNRLLRDVRPDEDLHFLPIPATADLAKTYDAASLTAADYPQLIEAGKPVQTLAVGTVLVTYNWPPGTERYRNVAHFVHAFFDKLRLLQTQPHQPEWRNVDLTATVPGWTRFAPAEEWVKKAESDTAGPHRPQQAAATDGAGRLDLGRLFADFDAYRRRHMAATDAARSPDPRRIDALVALFADFDAYQKRQAGAQGSNLAKLPTPTREARRKVGWPG